jgi:hypothetical protein
MRFENTIFKIVVEHLENRSLAFNIAIWHVFLKMHLLAGI